MSLELFVSLPDEVQVLVCMCFGFIFYYAVGLIHTVVQSIICSWRHKHDCKSKCFVWDCPCYVNCPHNRPYEINPPSPLVLKFKAKIKELFKIGGEQ